jgi:hypothetical protein
MSVVIGGDVGVAGRKHPCYAYSSLYSFFSSQLTAPGQILIDSLPDQICDRPPGRRRGLTKRFELTLSQLHLSPNHYANMLA